MPEIKSLSPLSVFGSPNAGLPRPEPGYDVLYIYVTLLKGYFVKQVLTVCEARHFQESANSIESCCFIPIDNTDYFSHSVKQ